jgi:hypothetical protein
MAGRALIKQQALQIGGLENESLLGWRQGNDPAARVFGDGFAMGHLGFTGTAFWMTAPDAKTKPGSYAIVLTNRVISGRINSLIRDFRKEVLSLFWQAL